MSWWSALGLAAVWVLATGLPALLAVYWIRQRAPARVSSRLLALGNLLACSQSVLVPVAAGFYHESWKVALLAALFEVFVGWSLAILMVAPLPARALGQHIERKCRAQRLPSLSVGIVRRHELVFAKSVGLTERTHSRAATPDTLYHIGSATKVFTTTLLAVLRDQGVVHLDDAVAQYLPSEVKLPTDPRGAPAITLRHLATHSSGLPRLPVNLHSKGDDPYAGYSLDDLYAGLAQTRLDFPTGARESYSNLGMGLLGHALERAAGVAYEELLQEHLFEPLGMAHTAITLGSEHRELLAQGYREDDPQREAADWDLGCLAPAGAIVSSVADLAMFLALQLRAGQADVTPVAGATLKELHTPQRLGEDWELAVGLGWYIARHGSVGNVVWHNGATAGHASFVAFVPRFQVGVVVLTNCGTSVDELGKWLLEEAVRTFGVALQPEVDPRLREAAHALARAIVPAPPDTIAELFQAAFLAEVPLEQVKQGLKEIHGEVGPCKGVVIHPSDSPRTATIEFHFAKGRTRQCDLEIDGAAAPKIVYAQFR
jgi:serine-type D-Ala-D-Ala carboxypeptidase/endopeptidase